MKKIGILGGTFDPIHYGHLVLAQEARVKFGLDGVIFMPAGSPPHKPGRVVSGAVHRYGMCLEATAANPAFTVSRLEIDRAGYSYTVDTIRALTATYTDAELYFIVGADAVADIKKWHNAHELLQMCKFIAATRAGSSVRKLEKAATELVNKYETVKGIYFLDIPGLNISSSALRKRVKNGEPVKYLVPAKVERYIKEHGLYKSNDAYFESVKQVLRQTLDGERYEHTMGVCKAAVKLAATFGADRDTAYLAALLHDCGKGLDNEQMREYCVQHGIELDELMEDDIRLAHGLIGADMAKRRFGVKNKAVLNAVKRHTFGYKRMTLLDKIIYVADVIEPGRVDIDEIAAARTAAEHNLNEALVLAMNVKNMHVQEKGGTTHPHTLMMMKKFYHHSRKFP